MDASNDFNLKRGDRVTVDWAREMGGGFDAGTFAGTFKGTDSVGYLVFDVGTYKTRRLRPRDISSVTPMEAPRG